MSAFPYFQSLWDTVHRMPHGLRINDTVLHWGLTQEMTRYVINKFLSVKKFGVKQIEYDFRKEIKFALEVEEALNRIAEPEYRELVKYFLGNQKIGKYIF